jgi:hypothetical protein
VDSGAGILTVEDSSGIGVPIQVGAATQFFFHHAAVPIGTGAGFLGTGLVRGFKVHASVDPTTTPMTARTVDIEAARYDGVLSALGGASFACTRTFSNAADDYSVNLTFCLAAAGSGAEFWTAVAGGVPAAMPPRGVSYATWNDAAAPSAWSAESACLEPIALPMGTVATAWSGTGFGLALPGGGSPVAVNLDFSSSPAPSVYRVDRTGGTVTVTPVDPTTAVGQSELASSFVPGTVVKVYATPGSAGGVNAHALFYYTGTLPLPFHD